jgi:hypothetical protein
MKAYLFLATGALWIIVAVLFSFSSFSFSIRWPKGTINPATIATIATILGLTPYVIVFGWIVPSAFGLWLLWARK